MLPDLDALSYFHFLRPAWGLLVVPGVILWWILRQRQHDGDLFGGIIAPHLLEHLRLQRFDTRWFNPRTLATALIACLLIVLMGPSWRQQPSPLAQDDSALVVLLDVSASMSQRDIQPSRIKRAQQKIGDLLALRPDKQTALIAYAGSAHTVLTLTSDQAILKQYLAAISPAMMPRPGKFPEYTLPNIDAALRQTTAAATVVLFTDGLGASSAEVISEYFGRHDHQLIVVGVGSESGQEGLIPLERRALEQLAKDSGGTYIPLTVDDGDVKRIDRRINKHYVILDNSALPWRDSGYPLVFLAMAIFLMWFRRGWTLSWAWLLVPLLAMPVPTPVQAADEASLTQDSASHWFADWWLTPDQQGRWLMQRGQYREAATRFASPTWKGMAYYYAEEFMLAAEYFSRSDSDDALFNEANARAQGRDYVRALARYDRLLARSPDYPGAASNRQTVQDLVDEINRLSESQQQEAGISGEDKELGSDDAIPAQGAEEITWETAELQQLTAEDILEDPATSEMWLRSVAQDPTDFLASKFHMQLLNQPAAQESKP